MLIKSASSTVQTEGSLGSAVATLELNSVIAHVLSRDLYNKPIEAAIREVLINAIDAHTEAGQTRPVELHLPSRLDDTFYVRDWGRGLSHEDMMRIYMDYGKSTRRNDNVAHGGLGLGTKAPLAYTDAFSVESHHDGEKRSYLIYYNEDGLPTRDLRSVEPTTETGLKVSFTVKSTSDATDFHSAAIAILRYIPPEKYTVNADSVAEKAKPAHLGINWHGPMGLRLLRDRQLEVQMGYQCYAADLQATLNQFDKGSFHCDIGSGIVINLGNALASFCANQTVTLKLPIGSVHPHPSRESVIITRHSAAELAKAFAEGLRDLFADFANVQKAQVPDIRRDAAFYDMTKDPAALQRFDNIVLRARVMEAPTYSWNPRPISRIISTYSELVQMYTQAHAKHSTFHLSMLDANTFVDYLGLGATTRNNPYGIDHRIPILVIDVDRTDPLFVTGLQNALSTIDLKEAAVDYIRNREEEEIAKANAPAYKGRSRRVVKSMADPAHNVLVLKPRISYMPFDSTGHGSRKQNWESAEESVESLRKKDRPIFWTETRMGCAVDKEETDMAASFCHWLSPMLAEHEKPLIIGLPASKGTKRFERAFQPLENFYLWADKILQSGRWRRLVTIHQIGEMFWALDLDRDQVDNYKDIDVGARDLAKLMKLEARARRDGPRPSFTSGDELLYRTVTDVKLLEWVKTRFLEAVCRVPLLSINTYTTINNPLLPNRRRSADGYLSEIMRELLREQTNAHIIKLNT